VPFGVILNAPQMCLGASVCAYDLNGQHACQRRDALLALNQTLCLTHLGSEICSNPSEGHLEGFIRYQECEQSIDIVLLKFNWEGIGLHLTRNLGIETFQLVPDYLRVCLQSFLFISLCDRFKPSGCEHRPGAFRYRLECCADGFEHSLGLSRIARLLVVLN
jgi:hypothetical protein